MARPTLFSHRKLLKLGQRLQSKSMAIGSLEMIWHVANETGNPVIGDADDIETITDWRGARGELVAALMECGSSGGPGFIVRLEDGQYEVHDFWHHAPDYVRKRAKRETERQTAGDELHAADRSKRRSTPASDRSESGRKSASDRSEGKKPAAHSDNTDQSLTGQNPVGSLKNGQNFRTPAPAPAPAPAPSEEDLSPLTPLSKEGNVEQRPPDKAGGMTSAQAEWRQLHLDARRLGFRKPSLRESADEYRQALKAFEQTTGTTIAEQIGVTAVLKAVQ